MGYALYLDTKSEEPKDLIGTVNKPLNSYSEKELFPGSEVLEKINAGLS